jgi:hypothetical protein
MIIQTEYELTSIHEYERKTRTWDYKFCFLPHRCFETGKLLWLEYAYRGYKTRRYDAQIIDNYMWMCSEEFIILRLMDKV